jgi:septum formation protein
MFHSTLPIYLASKSPRRRKLLKQLGLNFKAFSVDLHEEVLDGEHPIQTVKRLALHKMDEAVKKVKNGIVITADTIVVLDKEIIGKPKNKKDAEKILKKLSGKTHAVYTGFAIYNSQKSNVLVEYEKTMVTFRKLTTKEIKDYILSGSPMDKAGAYGIQDDFGAVFVRKINGCYYNVVGLPLSKLYSSLQKII